MVGRRDRSSERRCGEGWVRQGTASRRKVGEEVETQSLKDDRSQNGGKRVVSLIHVFLPLPGLFVLRNRTVCGL